jgi:hypothetical protein
VEGAFEQSLDRNSGRQIFSGAKPGRATVKTQDAPPPWGGITKKNSRIHTHALRLRSDEFFRYKLNGKIGLALKAEEICADAR